MSYECKTRFEVQKIVRDNILAGMEAYGIDASAFTVMEAKQTPPTAKTDFITFVMTGKKRAGWPMVKYGGLGDDFSRIEEFIEMQDWSVSVVKRRRQGEAIDEMSADDLLAVLTEWFNGMGCFEFRRSGVSCLLVQAEEDKKVKDDSSLTQNPSAIRLTLCVPKRLKIRHKIAEVAKPDIMPV